MFRRCVFVLALVASLFMLPHPSLAQPTTVPANFSDAVVIPASQIDIPTDINWLPNGQMLIAQQNGILHIVENGSVRNTPALNLGNRVCNNFERGLLGVAVDPDFTSNHFIYIYYTFNRMGQSPSSCDLGSFTNYPVNRVSRYTMDANNVAQPASELVLIDNMPSVGGNHNGGDLLFGKDGFLYVSVGDGGTDYANNSGSGGANDAARDRHVLLGKILRITKTGGIPADNPFQGAGTERCNDDAFATPGNHCRETWAWGLRNPFRIALDSNNPGTRIFINDVGQNVREEVDAGQSGADYGWNCREGTRVNNTNGPCNPTPANMIDPIFEYSHGNNAGTPFVNCNSITGGAFVPNGLWPAAYTGVYLFSDYVCGKIITLTPNGGSWTATEFGSGLGGVTSLEFGPDGSAQALYYTTYANGGEIHRVRYTGGGNQAPVASLSADPTTGTPPQAVDFDGSGSSDPEGGALRYIWNFGDGTAPISTTTPTISHSYGSAGLFTASLIVRDPSGLDSPAATVQIDLTGNNELPQITILEPAPSHLFSVGELITVTASATDPQDGVLGPASMQIDVLLHHDTHTHPYRSVAHTNTISFPAPAPEDLAAAANSYLELRVSATDSVNQTAVVTQALQPLKVTLSLASNPGGAELLVGFDRFTPPVSFTSWAGYRLSLAAPTQLLGGQWQRLASWSDGGAATHTITTPGQSTTYTATFSAPEGLYWVPLLPK